MRHSAALRKPSYSAWVGLGLTALLGGGAGPATQLLPLAAAAAGMVGWRLLEAVGWEPVAGGGHARGLTVDAAVAAAAVAAAAWLRRKWQRLAAESEAAAAAGAAGDTKKPLAAGVQLCAPCGPVVAAAGPAVPGPELRRRFTAVGGFAKAKSPAKPASGDGTGPSGLRERAAALAEQAAGGLSALPFLGLLLERFLLGCASCGPGGCVG